MKLAYRSFFRPKRALLCGLLLAISGVMSAPMITPANAQDTGSSSGGVRMVRPRGNVPPVHTVRQGDTLWDITGRYYGNPWHWPQVWSYNPEITNPHWIYPNDHVRLRGDGELPANLPTATSSSGLSMARAPAGTIWLRTEGFLDPDAVENAGEIVGSPEENMLLSNFDDVYVKFEGREPTPGTEFTVFRPIDEDEREEGGQGQLVRIYGTAILRTYDRERQVGRATITESLDPIERGFQIAPMTRRFDAVAPRENARDVEGSVVATLRPRELMADQQVIFVDVGSDQGVQVGNRFFVVRAGDLWDESTPHTRRDLGATVPEANRLEEYPAEVKAEARVVDVRPGSSTLMVTRSVHEVAMGDRVEMRSGF